MEVEAGGIMDLSTIIVNWNTRDLLRECLQSVYSKPCGIDLEVYVVDNASEDGSAEMVRTAFPQVRLLENQENLGYTRANNQAIRVSTGRNILLLNSDTRLDPSVLRETLELLHSDPSIGALGCKLVGVDGETQTSHYFFYPGGPEVGDPRRSLANGLIECAHVWGAFLLVKREVVDQVGMLDEDFFMFYEDLEWCWRMHDAGWKVVYDPQHSITHVCRASCGRTDPVENETRLLAAWATLMRKRDPSFRYGSWRMRKMLHHWRCANRYTLLNRIRPNDKRMEKALKHARLYQAYRALRPQ